ncbi:hypothetical protein B0H10DRAFT_2208857 [Mycena sp. CBHHK59/15]|nr:hypothetical protein B0H10DRAFT_2208857 [Mycena sp. CBHHK59/15]
MTGQALSYQEHQCEVVVPVAAGLGAAAIVLLAAPMLHLVGLSAIGPVAGTPAAGVQAGIGNVVAGSPFAQAQSIAMGGAAVPLVVIVLGSIAVGVAVYFGTYPYEVFEEAQGKVRIL